MFFFFLVSFVFPGINNCLVLHLLNFLRSYFFFSVAHPQICQIPISIISQIAKYQISFPFHALSSWCGKGKGTKDHCMYLIPIFSPAPHPGPPPCCLQGLNFYGFSFSENKPPFFCPGWGAHLAAQDGESF